MRYRAPVNVVMRRTRWWTGLASVAVGLGCGDSGGDGEGTSGANTGGSITGTLDTDTTDSPPVTGDDTVAETTAGPPQTESGSSEGSTGDRVAPEGSFWVFVTADQGVSTWSMDPATGALSFERALRVGSNVGPLAIRPDLSALYVGVTGQQQAHAHAIDPVTAELSPLGQVDLGFNPVYLATDNTGRSLLSVTFGGSELAIFPIGIDGSLGGAETQRLGTPLEPHAILTDASNQWLVVPHRTPDVIGQYAFDANTGMVSPNAVPQANAMRGAGARHLVFHPDRGYAYLADEFSDSVSTYAFDEGTGQLSLLETVSTLPNDFPGGDNTCADVHITPDGRFVYVSNRGHDSLAMFSVDAGTGQLSSLGQVPTEPRPREFEVSPRGRYVYAAGQDSGRLASYTVDQGTGVLVPGPVVDVGPDPLWVLAIELPPID
jgi:6-phosphogluconolactonase